MTLSKTVKLFSFHMSSFQVLVKNFPMSLAGVCLFALCVVCRHSGQIWQFLWYGCMGINTAVKSRGWDCNSVIEFLPCLCEAMDLNSSTSECEELDFRKG